MTGKKLLLAKLLQYSQLTPLINHFVGNKLVVCNYHRIYDATKSSQFDDGVYAHSIIEFERHLKWLMKNTKLLSEDELINIVSNGKLVSRICSLITFDDGYIDNYTLAYPILRRLGIPAIYFIPSGQIISRQLGWWDLIAYLIRNTKKTSIFYNNEIVNLQNDDESIHLFQKIMKTKPYEETSDLLQKLSEACDFPLPNIETQSKELMTWNQIREVSQNGIDIGSHTHSHRVLSTISSDEQSYELRSSKLIIEKEIGKKVRTIAYPVGGYKHFSPETMRIAAECGYEAAFSFNTGINNQSNLSTYDIKRIEPSVNIELLSASVTFPSLFC